MGVNISDIFDTELFDLKTYLKKLKPDCDKPIIWENN
jgi:hypothetical protein